MIELVHRPAGSGHPYRIDADQRHPVQLVAGEPFELRVLADASVDAVAVEFRGAPSAGAQRVPADELDHIAAPATAAVDGHLAAASGARPDIGGAAVWAWRGVAGDGGTVRYRFTAAGTATPWFAAAIGRWHDSGGKLTVVGDAAGVEPGAVEWLVTDDGPVRVRFRLPLAAGRRVVGFGERFDSLDQRGRTPDTVVFEQYKQQGPRTYLPSPFAVVAGPDGAYGVHVRTSRRVWFDVASTTSDQLVVETGIAPDEAELELRLYEGSPADIVSAHVGELGGLRRPPDWAFRPWMSANNWNTQARVLEEVERGIELGVPAGVVVIEAWSDESTFTAFRDAVHPLRPMGEPLSLADVHHPAGGAWPDPVGMVRWLHSRGVRVLLWQIPIVPTDRGDGGQVAADAQAMIEHGYCVAEADGTPYRNRGWWFPGGLLPDWTNPAARAWWLAKRRYLVEEIGVDGFKTDGGEHAWGDDLRYSDGSRGDTANNLFANRYAAAYTSLLDDCGVDGVTFSRAGFTGAGRFPCHWAGDEDSTWEAFRASIVAGLSVGLSGVAFWGWDLAGFSGPLPTVELYVRSAAMAALCPIMQYHSEFDAGDIEVGGESSGLADPADPAERPRRRDRTPWNIAEHYGDDRALELYRRFAVLRERLLPYLFEQADVSVARGLPMMRALLLGSPSHEAIWEFPYEYQLGDDLVVAPVCHEGATGVRAFIPDGEWVDAWSGSALAGPCVVERDVPWHEVAVYVRAGRAAELIPLFAGLP